MPNAYGDAGGCSPGPGPVGAPGAGPAGPVGGGHEARVAALAPGSVGGAAGARDAGSRGVGWRPANQSRASRPHSMLVATAISTGRKPVTKLAVKSISPATTLSPSRAPRCRRRQ